MLRRINEWARRNMPTREEMETNRYLAPIAHRFVSPELWRFTRRSVPRGVALGMFAGFIVPVGQIFLAAFLSLPLRANVPLAALMTFITNPFTLAFWLLAANRVGAFFLQVDAVAGGVLLDDLVNARWEGFGWFMGVAGVTAFGFIVLAVTTAAAGYVLSSWIWRFVVARKWARRGRRLMRIRAASSQNSSAE